MADPLHDLLTHAATHTLEGLCMALPDSVGEPQPGEAPRAAVEIGFTGPFSGSLILRAFGSVLDELAQTMTMADGPVSESEIGDALGEIANVVCGNLLPTLAGERTEFDVHSPIRVDTLDMESTELPIATAVAFEFLDGRIECQLALSDAGKKAVLEARS